MNFAESPLPIPDEPIAKLHQKKGFAEQMKQVDCLAGQKHAAIKRRRGPAPPP
jgi:hypothetical protein